MKRSLSSSEIAIGNIKNVPIDFNTLQSEEDFNTYNHVTLNKAISGMIIGDRNPQWTKEDAAEMASKSLSYIQSIPGLSGQINDRIAHRFPVSDLNLPQDSIAVLQTALRYTYENPFVAKASRIKADFAADGFKHRTHNKKVKEYYDKWAKALNLISITRKIFFSMSSIGIIPIWWGGEEQRNIEFIELLDPRMCHIEYNFGVPQLYLKIDEKMREACADPTGKVNIRNKARFEALPKYWVHQIQAAMSGTQYRKNPTSTNLSGSELGFIEIKQGSYAVVDVRASSLNRTVSALDGLPLQPAFDALQRYRLFTAGDFAVAWQLKNMVVLISEGDPKAEGDSWKPVSAQRLANLQANFQRPDSSYTVYCDPTTNVRFVVPPIKDVFTEVKYQQVEKEIKEVLDIPSFMWVSEDKSDYGNATNEMRVFGQFIKTLREILREQFFVPFYKRLRNCTTRPGFTEDDICYPSFSIANLKDDSFFLKECSTLYGQGLISAQTMMEIHGLDFDYEVAQKEYELKTFGKDLDTVLRPLFNPSPTAQPGEDGPGKPTGPNPKQAPGNDKNPRPGSGQK